MGLTDLKEIELPATFDAHVHLRDGAMMENVVPTIRQGGVNLVYVMVPYLTILDIYFLIVYSRILFPQLPQ